MDERALSNSALDIYREASPARGYRDLHAHVIALAQAGLLQVVDEPINKDTEMHPLVRWQFRGGIPESGRKAFLFTQPTEARAGATTWRSLSPGSPPIRDVYRIGFGRPLDEIGAGWVKAIAAPIAPRIVCPRRARRSVVIGDDLDRAARARRPAGADIDARLGQRALSVGRPLHHAGSGYAAFKTSAIIAGSSRRRAGSA